jgi:hypothetical protein
LWKAADWAKAPGLRVCYRASYPQKYSQFKYLINKALRPLEIL